MLLLRAARLWLGKNCSSLRMDKIRKASSEVISSLPCCPKVWKKNLSSVTTKTGNEENFLPTESKETSKKINYFFDKDVKKGTTYKKDSKV